MQLKHFVVHAEYSPDMWSIETLVIGNWQRSSFVATNDSVWHKTRQGGLGLKYMPYLIIGGLSNLSAEGSVDKTHHM